MQLFLDAEPVPFRFEKNAAEVTLPEDPNVWTNEILQELFKQVSYVADFNAHVVIDRMDAEQGYAFGHVLVTSKTESPAGAPPQQEQAAGIQQARIPIVIKDRRLYPFDILITSSSRMLPMSETRMRQTLFRPQAFDVTSKTPGDVSMIGQLYPPYRQNYGFGGGGAVVNMGMGKTGEQKCQRCGQPADKCGCRKEKVGSILSAILPTISERAFTSLADQLDDPEVKLAFMINKNAAESLERLSHYRPVAPEKWAFALANAIKYDVAQATRLGGGQYSLKVASHHMWAPITRVVDRGELVDVLGVKVALQVDQTGGVTMADGAVVSEEGPEADRPEPIKDFGVYKVETQDGRQLVGYCFPNLLDVDGTSLPLVLFTNGSEYAMQSDICGVRSGEGQAIPQSRPRGKGLLFRVGPNGKAEATVPLDIQTSLDQGEGVQFMAQSFAGERVRMVPAPNVKVLTASPGGAVLIPEDMSWLTLEGAKEVQLVEQPEQSGQKQAAAIHQLGVEIRSGDSNSFSLSGQPIEKLGHRSLECLTLDDAAFLLAGFGIEPNHAFKKLGESLQAGHPVVVPIGRMIKQASVRMDDAVSASHQLIEAMPQLKQPFLVKEAAVIPDTTAVDTILSLGFLNDENMLEFLKSLPVLDDAQSRMCELLLASRLGLKDVPSGALEKAIRAVEQVIEGLRVIAFQEN